MISSPVKYTLAVRHEFLKQSPGGGRGYTGISRTKSMERTRASGPPLRAVFSLPPRLRGEKTGWRVDFQAAGLSLRQRGCDPPGLHTTTASLERYAPPVDQSSAALSNPRPSDISIGRIQTRRRSKATRPDHPCTRVQERRAINHAYTSCTHHDQVLAAIKKSCSLRFLVYPRQRRFAIAEPTFFDRKRIVVSKRGSMDGWIDKKVWSFGLPYILKQ